jgi:hypothetical protein
MWDAGVTQANEQSYNIEVKITLSESETVRFLSEYNIGFIVDVALDANTRYTDIIREIDISLDKDGEVIQPIVSSPSHFKMATPAEEAAYGALKLGLELARNKR